MRSGILLYFRWLVLLTGTPTLGACADILGIAENPVLVETGPFRCVGNLPDPPAPTNNKAKVLVQTCNFVSSNCSAAVTGLTGTLCEKLDVGCRAPIQTGIRDVNGLLTFEVPTGGVLGTGFEGYLKLAAQREPCTNAAVFGPPEVMACALLAPMCNLDKPDEYCNIPTFTNSLVFFNPPVRTDAVVPITVPLVPAIASLTLVGAAGSVPVDPSSGSAVITVLDCDGRPAAGATVRAQGQTPAATLYVANGVPTTGATETDASGFVVLLGLQRGFASFVANAVHEPGNPVIGQVSVQVDPLSLSYVYLVPSR